MYYVSRSITRSVCIGNGIFEFISCLAPSNPSTASSTTTSRSAKTQRSPTKENEFGIVKSKTKGHSFRRQTMKRRSLLILGVLAPLAFLRSRYLSAGASKALSPADYQQRAQQLNELAANIQTPADAHRLVDFISDLFSDETLYRLKSSSLRNQIAQAEFSAVSDSQKLIPEPRLAQAWNTYVDTIGAPEDRKVTPAELHNLRDAFQTTARVLWDRGSRNIWTVPTIYATLPDGRVASAPERSSRFACFGISRTCLTISKEPVIV